MEQFAKLARGSIAPDPDHPALGPLALADADGSLYTATDELLPGRCIDGRRPTTPYQTIAPCAPGASLSLLIGLAATRGITDPIWGAGELAARLTEAGMEPHIHTGPDDHSSGCGALDWAPDIIALANETEPLVRECAEALDMRVLTTYPLASLTGEALDSAGIYRIFHEDPGSRVTPLRGVHWRSRSSSTTRRARRSTRTHSTASAGSTCSTSTCGHSRSRPIGWQISSASIESVRCRR